MTIQPAAPPYGRTKIFQPNGRPVWAVNDANGMPVICENPPSYLTWDGRTYRVSGGAAHRQRLGTDFQRAIYLFRQLSSPEKQPFTIEPVPEAGKTSEQLARRFKRTLGGKAVIKVDIKSPEVCKQIFNWLTSNPSEAARLIGLPELARLTTLPVPEKSITLKEVIEFWGVKGGSTKSRKDTLAYWAIFTKSVKANTLSDIQQADVEKWFSSLSGNGNSPRTIRNKVMRVKAVIQYCHRKNKDRLNCDKILGYITALDLPVINGAANPNPLSKADWTKLYEAGENDTFWKCVLLLSLNCLFRFTDLIKLPKAAINLEAGTITWRRPKTGVVRVCCLWPETVESIEQYMKARPHKQAELFLSEKCEPYQFNGLRNKWVKWRNSNGLKNIKHDQIRDGGYTAAVSYCLSSGVDSRLAKITAGHKTDISDQYVLRSPEMVRGVCEAIRQAYGL